MGMCFGLVFGIMDIEDVSARLIKDYLMKEENYCIPIGVVLGAIAGLFVSSSDNNVFYYNNLMKNYLNYKKNII